MSKVQVKITVDKEVNKEQQEQLDSVADYALRRARFIMNEDQEHP